MSAPESQHPPRSPDAPFDWAIATDAVDDVVRAMDLRVAARRRQRRRTRLALSAALCAAVLASFLHFRPEASPPPALAARPSVPAVVSLPLRQTLPDGTTVDLKAGAQITVSFSEHLRRVVLVAGEAHFEVAKNPARPFVVAAGAVEFRAVGTAFSIDLGHTETELVVTEGRVAVDHPPTAAGSASAQTLALVTAGNKLVVPAAPALASTSLAERIEPLAPPQLTARLAWRVPRLELSATPLADVLPLFSQHSGTRLVLADPALGQLRLSGILRADNIDTLLDLLAESHGIRVEPRPDGALLLRRR